MHRNQVVLCSREAIPSFVAKQMDWQLLHKMAIRSKTSLPRRMDQTVAAEEVVVNASAIATTKSKEMDRLPSCSTRMGFTAANRYQITVKAACRIAMGATAVVKAFQN